MSEIVHDCPRCNAGMVTFSCTAEWKVNYGHTPKWEVFSTCRKCLTSSIFVVELDRENTFAQHLVSGGLLKVPQLNVVAKVVDVVKPPPKTVVAPEFLPPDIGRVFKEGAMCVAMDCPNAAGTMFRLCLDLATASLLPEDPDTPAYKIRRDLGLRLPWLFENGRLPAALHDLSSCVKEDGNDGAHRGTLTKVDAEDLLDFTRALLDRLYSEPERLRQAMASRTARREAAKK